MKDKSGWRTPPWHVDPAVTEFCKKACKGPVPKFSKTPVEYRGGRIHFSASRSALRVYIRGCDKVEKHLAFNPADKGQVQIMKYACRLIDVDPRPRT